MLISTCFLQIASKCFNITIIPQEELIIWWNQKRKVMNKSKEVVITSHTWNDFVMCSCSLFLSCIRFVVAFPQHLWGSHQLSSCRMWRSVSNRKPLPSPSAGLNTHLNVARNLRSYLSKSINGPAYIMSNYTGARPADTDSWTDHANWFVNISAHGCLRHLLYFPQFKIPVDTIKSCPFFILLNFLFKWCYL